MPRVTIGKEEFLEISFTYRGNGGFYSRLCMPGERLWLWNVKGLIIKHVSGRICFFCSRFIQEYISGRNGSMNKMTIWSFLCMIVFVTAGCESLIQWRQSKPDKPVSAPAPSVPSDAVAAEAAARPLKSSGYLSEGATVRMDMGDGRSNVSMIEQFDQTKREGVFFQEKIDTLEKTLANEKTKVAALEKEVEKFKEQQSVAGQITQENEELRKQLEKVQAPYEKRIADLAMELTKAQIGETKAKQELISLKIEMLMEKKKQPSPNEQ